MDSSPWTDRWPNDSSDQAPPTRRRRITHLVLVDGLPADHWVEEDVEGRWSSGPSRRARPGTLDDTALAAQELAWLEGLVGGPDALTRLHDSPLPTDEPTLGRLTTQLCDGLADALRPRVTTILEKCDHHLAGVFGQPELAAAVRNLLAAALTADPLMLVRSTRDDTAVGALVWAVGQANGLIGPQGALLARDLWPRLGVPASSASRGAAMLDRVLDAHGPAASAPPGAPQLRRTAHPEVLVAATRALIIARRDAATGSRGWVTTGDGHDQGSRSCTL